MQNKLEKSKTLPVHQYFIKARSSSDLSTVDGRLLYRKCHDDSCIPSEGHLHPGPTCPSWPLAQ